MLRSAAPSALCPARTSRRAQRACGAVRATAELKALLFDCDGVILESEELHRVAYNAVFAHHAVTVHGQPVTWSVEHYDMLSNTVGGGKPKMRWHFSKHGWPEASGVLGRPCITDADKDALIDGLQEWKTAHYEQLIASGAVAPRPGVLRLMDEARAAGLALAVCSAATKSAAVATVSSLLGPARWGALDCFLAGSDVPKLKPDPLIYVTAAQRLGLSPAECVVIEDSTFGAPCVITYTRTGLAEPFAEAALVVSDLDAAGGVDVARLKAAAAGAPRFDDRVLAVA